MSVISDLIEKINDPDLRVRLSEEVARMQKKKKIYNIAHNGAIKTVQETIMSIIELNS